MSICTSYSRFINRGSIVICLGVLFIHRVSEVCTKIDMRGMTTIISCACFALTGCGGADHVINHEQSKVDLNIVREQSSFLPSLLILFLKLLRPPPPYSDWLNDMNERSDEWTAAGGLAGSPLSLSSAAFSRPLSRPFLDPPPSFLFLSQL